ncbi:MAG: S8 family serine peptidase [Myxococcota bacterium]
MPRTPRFWRWLAPALAVACATPDRFDTADTSAGAAELPAPVVEALVAGWGASVIVRIDDADVRADVASLVGARRVSARAERWRARADTFSGALPASIRTERVFHHFPVVVLHLSDLDDAYALAARADVLSIEPDVAHAPTLTDTLALIDQPAAEADGYTGAGTSVAVLDTGADWTHADLGSCTAVGSPASCRVAYAADIATSDGERDDDGHGTNVASIVAAVAPDADIVALDVFRTDGYAWSSDILSAIDWVITYQSTYAIAAINLSLGAGAYTAPCTNAYSASVASARDAGVSVVVASGNDGYTDAIGSPACVDEALSVGAVYDTNFGGVGWTACTDTTTAADKVTCFSNSADFLDILAPGALVTAGGYTMGGTSMAAPHVAGAMAVLRSADPDVGIDALEARLLESGPTITDSRNGLRFPRLDLLAAVTAGVEEEVEDAVEVAPTGTLSISGGAAWTSSRSVTVTLAATDDVGVTYACLSNTTTCSSWFVMSATKAWTLASSSGTNTVYGWFIDAAGNTSTMASDTIGVDTTRPTNGTVTAAGSDAAARITWTGYSDASAGLASYLVVFGTSAPASGCTSGTVGYSGTAASATLSGLTNGETYHVRVCALDRAGNTSTGTTTTVRPAPEYTVPTGTITLNGGAAWSTSRSVTATLAASDDTGVASMCLSNTTTCSSWVTYGTSASWTLGATAGTQTVYAWFKDRYGNVSTTRSDTLGYDATAPSDGRVTVAGTTRGLSLSWSGYTDRTSRLASYKVVYAAGSAPISCSSGTVAYAGTARRTSLTGLAARTTYGVRVCAVDTAGNVSVGTTGSATTM